MEPGDSILDAIHEGELSFEDDDDVDMMDVEEGEVLEGQISRKIGKGNENDLNKEPRDENSQHTKNMNKKKQKKKKNRKKKGNPGSNGINIDRFVLDVCRRLREEKSYLVYSAVGVLGISALSDLVKEVDAVQACGGQKTALGDRFRKGGGVLWNILKVRDPNAYKEIMKKGREFEKQFRRPSVGKVAAQNTNTSQSATDGISRKSSATTSDDDVEVKPAAQEQPAQSGITEKRRPVCERLRVPVSYDDLPVEEPPKDSA